MSAGLYVHFPFCAAKCPYCHFYSVPWTEAGLRTWRECLEREAAAAAAAREPGFRFDTLYLGGGTPSLLGPADVARIGETGRAPLRRGPRPSSRSRPIPRGAANRFPARLARGGRDPAERRGPILRRRRPADARPALCGGRGVAVLPGCAGGRLRRRCPST
ncbi:MAG: hypothetical protein M0C28_42255 [Candidatus Moduliflexus flocculans]|nr:hypothetical protein [Candidatus Moduliflexus flocculans]